MVDFASTSDEQPLEAEWLRLLMARQERAARLLDANEDDQLRQGYVHTLREILQQPFTWLRTADQMAGEAPKLRKLIAGASAVILTGSGSSEYAGDCLRLGLQDALGMTVASLSGGAILTHGSRVLPPQRPALMISFARSGDSPESVGAMSLLLEIEPEIRQVIVTCNANGTAATTYWNDPRVHVITLDDRTNDRSLVMTSSFTNMTLASRIFGMLAAPERYLKLVAQLGKSAEQLLLQHFDRLGDAAALSFERAVYLGSGSRFAAAREASLKMLEMTAGRIPTLCETYLGFRHGPMSFADSGTLLVCFLSSDPMLRAYESDLLREINRKELGRAKLLIGVDVPSELVRHGDIVVNLESLTGIGDEDLTVLHVVAAQLLAFFRCLQEGLRPDDPSEGNVINRVVENFQLHAPVASGRI